MKKILTASLVAMMAVTAANADIASTQYVNTKTGDLQFAGAKVVQSASNLTAAVMALDEKLGTVAGTGEGSVESQIGSAIGGLDSTQDGAGTVVKSVSQTDGKVSVTVGTIANADVADNAAIAQSKIANLTTDLAAKQTKDNIVSLDSTDQLPQNVDNPNEKYPSYSATEKMIDGQIAVFSEGVSNQVIDINKSLDKKADKTALAATDAKVAANESAIAAEKTARESADTQLQGKIDALNNGDNSVSKQIDNKIGTLADGAKDVATAIANAQAAAATDATSKANKALDDAKADATSKANTAESNAKSFTTEQLKNYTDTAGMGSAIATAKSQAIEEAGTAADGKIAALDVADTAVAGSYVSAVSETDGKISVTRAALTPVAKMDVPADCATKLCALVYDKEKSSAGNPVLKWEVIAE